MPAYCSTKLTHVVGFHGLLIQRFVVVVSCDVENDSDGFFEFFKE